MINPDICHKARLARDSRFDGLFFTAVKSTGIFCRPICPARAPAEHQVCYYPSAAAASAAGYRPCLRCRPDSAPGSAAWQGSNTTLQRAIRLIDDGGLQQQTQHDLACRLGITERYLRKLFQQHLGMPPKQYALAQQVLFAKKLLHETTMPVNHIAFHAGFNSVRRFNDAFKQQLKLSPLNIRRQNKASGDMLQLTLSYRPPLAWQQMLDFWRARTLEGIDWVDAQRYGRTFSFMQQPGWFVVEPAANNNLKLQLHWPGEQGLFSLVQHLRRLLDLDANLLHIEQQLTSHPLFSQGIISGLRIPGVWSSWEAGVRAVLGQQVSVAGARTQLNRLVQALGKPLETDGMSIRLFPSPQALASSDLQMIKVPQARRDTLKALAQFVLQQSDAAPEHWLAIKGIGPWTVSYARLRGLSDTDVWLGGDLGVQKALAKAGNNGDINALAPWRSYATFQLWFSLGA
ncbi:DNA-3-methyladenine glycosylase 2 family protein [Rheinheimera maricola]|uniref:DNA-3-methyladenine glycosylase II n=1 Tax=Rheinheimera maricola TaxID=2793282 RepID=A0ABS7XDW8_9GAMM|nr:AlkA N-terminal domain-containing protein [Rheinheimera maricola]MBZ9612898.1 helix-turn-helix domain-containing protein [Rheinheimera maricola]